MKQLIAKFLKDESGASLIEYILIAAVIGVGAIAGMTALRQDADTTMTAIGTKMTGAVQP
jgi:pilus assembly protein Flp/PilA